MAESPIRQGSIQPVAVGTVNGRLLEELSDVKRIHRLEGTGGATPDFLEMPIALNGASHLINVVFGEKGAHSRMIYSNPSMPVDCVTLLVYWAEVDS